MYGKVRKIRYRRHILVHIRDVHNNEKLVRSLYFPVQNVQIINSIYHKAGSDTMILMLTLSTSTWNFLGPTNHWDNTCTYVLQVHNEWSKKCPLTGPQEHLSVRSWWQRSRRRHERTSQGCWWLSCPLPGSMGQRWPIKKTCSYIHLSNNSYTQLPGRIYTWVVLYLSILTWTLLQGIAQGSVSIWIIRKIATRNMEQICEKVGKN